MTNVRTLAELATLVRARTCAHLVRFVVFSLLAVDVIAQSKTPPD